ncbi:MAG: hypothetical protein LUI15_06920, partial [Firmicutes bacterium]|nr:hypothetical protein [Bacillota bacterium]
MKTYKEIADEVLRRRDEYETKRRERINAVKRAGTVTACLVAAAGVSFSVYFIAKYSIDGNAENEDYSESDGVKSNAPSHGAFDGASEGASEGYEGVDDGVADGEAADTDDSAVSNEELYETEGDEDHSAENSANPKESPESGSSNLYESQSDEVTDGDENDSIDDEID